MEPHQLFVRAVRRRPNLMLRNVFQPMLQDRTVGVYKRVVMTTTTSNALKSAARGAVRRVAPDLWRYLQVRSYVRQTVPDGLEHLDPAEFVPKPGTIGTGVDLREAEQLALLTSWTGRFDSLFAALREDPQINPQAMGKPYVLNDYYPTPDAEVYAAMIADRKPSKIIEIGAGFSTRIARRTIEELSAETKLIVVDPEPRAEVSSHADTVFRQRFEDVDPAALDIDEGTLLFVDSSHIVRAEGDVATIFCRIIPSLPAGVLVHVHDVFLPYDYPPAYLRRLYTEAYVLWALLARGSRFQVRFATHFMVRTQAAAMQRTFGAIVGTNQRYYGASFWFELI
jgi:hypothetical protein